MKRVLCVRVCQRLIQLISKGLLEPLRGSFYHKLNFNCFMPEMNLRLVDGSHLETLSDFSFNGCCCMSLEASTVIFPGLLGNLYEVAATTSLGLNAREPR